MKNRKKIGNIEKHDPQIFDVFSTFFDFSLIFQLIFEMIFFRFCLRPEKKIWHLHWTSLFSKRTQWILDRIEVLKRSAQGLSGNTYFYGAQTIPGVCPFQLNIGQCAFFLHAWPGSKNIRTTLSQQLMYRVTSRSCFGSP